MCAHLKSVIAEWEDVPRDQEARPSSPEMFEMDTEHVNDTSSTPPPPVRLPPGLRIQPAVSAVLPPGLGGLKPAVPAVQPFNMFAQQQVSTRPSPGSCCACCGCLYHYSCELLRRHRTHRSMLLAE